jgi:mono/diheme cytochrome c family protein
MRSRTLLAAVCFALFVVPSGFSAFADEGEEVLPAISNPVYQKECSACHMAYQPELLPDRSWRKLMDTLEDHFGDNAGLDDATRQEILAYLIAHSADKSTAEISKEILASIPSKATPIRISETKFFTHEHREIKPAVFKRKGIGSASNCSACHTTASEGNYEEDGVQIPRQ